MSDGGVGEIMPSQKANQLNPLTNFSSLRRHICSEEVVEQVCVPVLVACAGDAEGAVRGAAARGATELALACAGDAASDLIALLEKVSYYQCPQTQTQILPMASNMNVILQQIIVGCRKWATFKALHKNMNDFPKPDSVLKVDDFSEMQVVQSDFKTLITKMQACSILKSIT